jgi:N,N'-diacetyllegionaminate synthase
MRIGDRTIGDGAPCFVIAEAGVNHDGDVTRAHQLIDAASAAGADAVKFQTFVADRLVTDSAPTARYQQAAGERQTQREMLRRLELPRDAYDALIAHAATVGLVWLSTPFDEECADFLDALGMAAFKTSSGELTNHGFLTHVARKGKPMLVSTGMSTLDEVTCAVRAIAGVGAPEHAGAAAQSRPTRLASQTLALLHCVSSYPADVRDTNLRAMTTLATAFAVPVGYSDHVPGPEASLAAVALGASVIEKHLTLDRRAAGPDHAASTEPDEFRRLVASIRAVEAALGTGDKRPVEAERDTARVARKSLAAARPLTPGTTLEPEMLVAMRPGTGIAPSDIDRVVGRPVRAAVAAGTLIAWEDLE